MVKKQNLPRIIGLVGPVRAGKSTAAYYLSERYEYVIKSNSDVLKSVLEALQVKPSRPNLSILGNALFSELGRDIIAKGRLTDFIRRAEMDANYRIVIDGIRYPEEIDLYRSTGNFLCIAVGCDQKVRYQRTKNQSETEKDGNISYEGFVNINQLQSERDVPTLIEGADVNILNEDDKDSFFRSISRAIEGNG